MMKGTNNLDCGGERLGRESGGKSPGQNLNDLSAFALGGRGERNVG